MSVRSELLCFEVQTLLSVFFDILLSMFWPKTQTLIGWTGSVVFQSFFSFFLFFSWFYLGKNFFFPISVYSNIFLKSSQKKSLSSWGLSLGWLQALVVALGLSFTDCCFVMLFSLYIRPGLVYSHLLLTTGRTLKVVHPNTSCPFLFCLVPHESWLKCKLLQVWSVCKISQDVFVVVFCYFDGWLTTPCTFFFYLGF